MLTEWLKVLARPELLGTMKGDPGRVIVCLAAIGSLTFSAYHMTESDYIATLVFLFLMYLTKREYDKYVLTKRASSTVESIRTEFERSSRHSRSDR